jgi:hypothetical protein
MLYSINSKLLLILATLSLAPNHHINVTSLVDSGCSASWFADHKFIQTFNIQTKPTPI